MGKCVICSKDYAGRATSRYCSPKCKQTAYRNRIKPGSVTPVTVTNLEKCQYCGVDLPRLQLPRQYPGACYPCVLKQPTKAKEFGDIPEYVWTQTPYSEQVKMTDSERADYKPAAELEPGECNKVAKPHAWVCSEAEL